MNCLLASSLNIKIGLLTCQSASNGRLNSLEDQQKSYLYTHRQYYILPPENKDLSKSRFVTSLPGCYVAFEVF